MSRSKAVPQTADKAKGQASHTSVAQKPFVLEVEADLASFMDGKKYRQKTIGAHQYYVLTLKNKFFIKIIKLTKKTKIDDVKRCFEILLAYRQAISRFRNENFLKLLSENGEHESFVFFENSKCISSMMNNLANFYFTITKTGTNKIAIAINDENIIEIVGLLDEISNTDHSEENLRKIARSIRIDFPRALADLDQNFNAFIFEEEEFRLDDARLKIIFNNLIAAGAYFPHNGLTFQQLVKGHSTTDTNITQFLRVSHNKKATDLLRERASRFLCRGYNGKLFYLNPDVRGKS